MTRCVIFKNKEGDSNEEYAENNKNSAKKHIFHGKGKFLDVPLGIFCENNHNRKNEHKEREELLYGKPLFLHKRINSRKFRMVFPVILSPSRTIISPFFIVMSLPGREKSTGDFTFLRATSPI